MKNNLPKIQKKSDIQLYNSVDKKFNLKAHAITTRWGGYILIEEKLYQKAGCNWVVYGKEDRYPKHIIRIDKNWLYWYRTKSKVFYKSIKSKEIIIYDLVLEKVIDRILWRFGEIDKLRDIEKGKYYYLLDAKNNLQVYDKNFHHLNTVFIPIFLKHGHYKQLTNAYILFASFPERCEYTKLILFNRKTQRFSSVTEYIWYGIEYGAISDKDVTVFSNMEGIYTFDLKQKQISRISDSVSSCQVHDGYLYYDTQDGSIIRRGIHNTEIETVAALEFSAAYKATTKLNRYYHNKRDNLIILVSNWTHKVITAKYSEKIIAVTVEADASFDYIITQHSNFRAIRVIHSKNLATITDFKAINSLEISVCATKKTDLLFAGIRFSGIVKLETNYANRVKIQHNTNGKDLKEIRALKSNEITALSSTKGWFNYDWNSMELNSCEYGDGKENNAISFSKIVYNKDEEVFVRLGVETKYFKHPHSWYKTAEYKTFLTIVNADTKEDLFSYTSEWERSHGQQCQIVKDRAYFFASNQLKSIHLETCRIETIYPLTRSPGVMWNYKDKYLILGIASNESYRNPHFLVFNVINRNIQKIEVEKMGYKAICQEDSIFSIVYLETRYIFQYSIQEAKNELIIKQVFQQLANGITDLLAIINGTIVCDWEYGTQVALFNIKRKRTLGYLTVFSDYHVVVTSPDSKYFYCSNPNNIMFTNNNDQIVEMDKLQYSIYNRVKILEIIGLKKENIDLFRALSKLQEIANGSGRVLAIGNENDKFNAI